MVKEGRVLGVIGCGRMGTAIVQGLHRTPQKLFEGYLLYDIDVEQAEKLAQHCGGESISTMRDAVDRADVLLLAVKPQVMRKVLCDLAPLVSVPKLVLSVAAGVSTSFLETCLGDKARVVRAMPNTPCLVGKGVTAICRGSRANSGDEDLARRIFSTLGEVYSVAEEQMDAITALSGSGPAYFWLMAEAMVDVGVDLGLTRTLATELVKGTLVGATSLWVETGDHPVLLREQVTSPGGTTIAALRKLEEEGLRKAVFAAVERAAVRSRELSLNLDKDGVL